MPPSDRKRAAAKSKSPASLSGSAAMPPKRERPVCSFCGRDDRSVARLIAGPGVNICSECVAHCRDILEQGNPPLSPAEAHEKTGAPAPKSAPRDLKVPAPVAIKVGRMAKMVRRRPHPTTNPAALESHRPPDSIQVGFSLQDPQSAQPVFRALGPTADWFV